MNDTIFLHNENGLTALNKTLYKSEDLLQKLIEENPELLAGEQINPDNPRKWIFISREMSVPTENGGLFLDHLFIDQDGIPTLVEVKRSTDTRIRREVVGQMLDYAANATINWKIEDIQRLYNGDLISDFGFDDEKANNYWSNVENNLKLGKIRLIFAADYIPETLRRIIEFLNIQMRDTEVLGLEIKQFISNDNKCILVPTIIGRTIQAIDAKQPRQTKSWNYDSFIEDIQSLGNDEIYLLTKKIIDDFKKIGCRIYYGKGATHPSIVICYDLPDNSQTMQLFSIYTWKSKKVFSQFYFKYYKSPYDTDNARYELKKELENILSASIPDDKINKMPSFPYEKLLNKEVYDKFIKKFKEIIKHFQANNSN